MAEDELRSAMVAISRQFYREFRQKRLETLESCREQRDWNGELLQTLGREKNAPAKLIRTIEADIVKWDRRIEEAERDLAAFDAEFKVRHTTD